MEGLLAEINTKRKALEDLDKGEGSSTANKYMRRADIERAQEEEAKRKRMAAREADRAAKMRREVCRDFSIAKCLTDQIGRRSAAHLSGRSSQEIIPREVGLCLSESFNARSNGRIVVGSHEYNHRDLQYLARGDRAPIESKRPANTILWRDG